VSVGVSSYIAGGVEASTSPSMVSKCPITAVAPTLALVPVIVASVLPLMLTIWVCVIFFACVCVGASDMTTASDDPSY
jgi:hypothetical protein